MRTIDVIDEELRLLVTLRVAASDAGGRPTIEVIDELLDERIRVGLSTPALAGATGGGAAGAG
jgi:hypothetical protein